MKYVFLIYIKGVDHISNLECYSDDDVIKSVSRLYEIASVLVTDKKYEKDIDTLKDMMEIIDYGGVNDVLKNDKGDD